MSRKQLSRSGGDLASLGTDDTGCTILHLDMDAFFVSVELLERPELIGTAVIVGGRSGRGVVVSASYEAREFGVHAAMPMSRAVSLCPHATVIPPSKGRYGAFSRRVFEVVAAVTEDFAQVSVDEGYLDVTSALRRLGSPARIASDLRREIRERTGLAASIGVADSMVVAKLASARAKPDGLLVVPVADVAAFLRPMPVEALPGVGARTQSVLARYGIRRIAELADADPAWLQRILGSAGPALHRYAHGRDGRTVHSTARDHTISGEHTFPHDIADPAVLELELLRLADTVASRLRGEGKAAGSVGLKYRLSDFTTFSRSVTLPAPSDVAVELHAALLPALRKLHDDHRQPVRLLGLRAADLVDLAAAGRQSALDEPEHSPREAELALDAVRRRFGTAAIGQASLMRPRPGRGPDPAPPSGRGAGRPPGPTSP
ncbi:DNA polymerase IV [Brevibacterium ihuae]|uniref:DNA polymerase IV n=1 Tax=Brevibacterium ihuae TaxID=1631743 RepID=UPI000C77083A|nr:DNA polymerase IV [Brevibacterium ihuae]